MYLLRKVVVLNQNWVVSSCCRSFHSMRGKPSRCERKLFARLGATRQEYCLHEELFSFVPSGIKLGDLIEICGKEGSGKTEILYSIIANCIVPAELTKDSLDEDTSVHAIFIDTDHKFSVLRLTKIVELRIRHMLYDTEHRKSKGGDATVTAVSSESIQIDRCIKNVLRRLLVYRTASSSELGLVLQSIDTVLAYHKDASLLIIDSISSYYVMDRGLGVSRKQQESKQRRFTELLAKITDNHHVVTVVTKLLLFEKKQPLAHGKSRISSTVVTTQEHQEFMSQVWQSKVTHRFLIKDNMRTDPKLENSYNASKSLSLIKPSLSSLQPLSFYITENGVEVVNT